MAKSIIVAVCIFVACAVVAVKVAGHVNGVSAKLAVEIGK